MQKSMPISLKDVSCYSTNKPVRRSSSLCFFFLFLIFPSFNFSFSLSFSLSLSLSLHVMKQIEICKYKRSCGSTMRENFKQLPVAFKSFFCSSPLCYNGLRNHQSIQIIMKPQHLERVENRLISVELIWQSYQKSPCSHNHRLLKCEVTNETFPPVVCVTFASPIRFLAGQK